MAETNYPSDWDRRRRQTLQRDNYTCQNCGARGGPKGDAELHAHHGVPVSKGGSHNVSNLITYCQNCHDAIHGSKMAPTATDNPTQPHLEDMAFNPFGTIMKVLFVIMFFFSISTMGWIGLFGFIVALLVYTLFVGALFGDSQNL